MTTDTKEQELIQTFEIRKEIEIAAPIDLAFEAVLDELGPEGQMPGGKPSRTSDPSRQRSATCFRRERGDTTDL